jgi:hypothetical protein
MNAVERSALSWLSTSATCVCDERGTGVEKDLALTAYFYRLPMNGGFVDATAADERVRLLRPDSVAIS